MSRKGGKEGGNIDFVEVPYHVTRPSGFVLEGTLVHPAAEAPAGPVVIFMHGTMSFRDHNFVPELCQKLCKDLGARSYRFDFRFDQSEQEPNHRYTFSGYNDDVNDMECVIRQLRKDGFTPFVLFGHSRGSNDALIYASTRLQQLTGNSSSLLLAADGGNSASTVAAAHNGGESSSSSSSSAAAAASHSSAMDSECTLHLLDADKLAVVVAAPRFDMKRMPQCIFNAEQLALLESQGRFAWPSTRSDRLVVTQADIEVVERLDMEAVVQNIPANVPVLLFHGDEDELIPHEDAHSYHRTRPSIELCVVEGARHAFRGKKPLKQLLTTATAFIGRYHAQMFGVGSVAVVDKKMSEKEAKAAARAPKPKKQPAAAQQQQSSCANASGAASPSSSVDALAVATAELSIEGPVSTSAVSPM